MSARKPQLTPLQQRHVDEARKIADASAQDLAGDYEFARPSPHAYAFGFAQSTIKSLLQVIEDLTGGAS